MQHGVRALWAPCLAISGISLGSATGAGATAVEAKAETTGCAGVVALLQTQYRMFDAFLDGDAGRLAAGIDGLASLVEVVRATPPTEIGAEIDVWLANAEATVSAVDGVTEPDALLATLSTMPPPPAEFTTAQQAVERWAGEHCAWTPPGTGPADCRLLDAGAAAAAAGLDIDTSAPERVDDGAGPGFATQACTYGGGTLALTTVAFDDRDSTEQQMVGMATTIGGGRQIDVGLGELPETAVVIEFAGAVQIIVFDADVPFAITVSGVEPAAAIAAAAAVAAAFPSDPPAVSARAASFGFMP